MPLTALVRNLGKMSAVGLVKPFSQAAELVVRKLKDEALLLKRARTLQMQNEECKVKNEAGPAAQRRFSFCTMHYALFI